MPFRRYAPVLPLCVGLLAGPLLRVAPGAGPDATASSGPPLTFTLEAEGTATRDVLTRLAGAGLRVYAPAAAPEAVFASFSGVGAREAATRLGAALGGLTPLAVTFPDPLATHRTRLATEYYLVPPGREVRRLLEAYLAAGRGRARPHLYAALRARGAAAAPEIAALLADPGRALGERVLAAKLLGASGVPSAVAALSPLLDPGVEPELRQAAVLAIGWAGPGVAEDRLHALLADADAGVRLSAAWALARGGDRSGVPLARQALHDSDLGTAMRAVDVLEASADPGALDALERAAETAREPLRPMIRTAIARLGLRRLPAAERAAEAATLLASGEAEIRLAAALELEAIEGDRGAAELERAALDPGHPGRSLAAAVLARIGRLPGVAVE